MILLLPLSALFLVSCSAVSLKNVDEDFNLLLWHRHKQELSDLNQFQMHGLLICSYDKKKICASFTWNQINKTHYYLTLTNLLGSTILKLNTKSGFIQFADNQRQFFTSIDAEKIINELTGISIPFNNLHQWILGLPASATKYKLNNQYLLSEILYTQNNRTWKIVYNGYDNKIRPILPSNIKIIGANQSIVLKINKWVIK